MYNFFDKDDVIIRIYSDNIIFAHKSRCPGAPVFDFYLVRSYMAQYQLFLLSSGLLSRGFITQGRLFINDSFIMGAALAKAHEAEKYIVKYPRVVVDPKLMELLPDQIHQYPIPPDRFLKKDRADGFYFLNYYQALIQGNGKIWHRELFSATKTIINNLKSYRQETLPKLYWLIKYHNAFCKKYHCDEFIIPREVVAKIKKNIRTLA